MSDPILSGIAPAALLADLRERAFGIGAAVRPRRIGAEVELIPVSSETRRVLPIEDDVAGPSSLRLLRRFGAERGWVEESLAGLLGFRLPDGGVVSWEPGGQIELSTRPFASATELLGALRGVVLPLRAMAAEEGVEMLSVGIDPFRPVEAAPLYLRVERYVRMAAYFDAFGPAGARMMRQTASFQLNLDWETEPLLRWRVLNAAAPYLTAIFANSAVYAGAATGHHSFRARCWRELDPSRTGVLGHRADAAGEYLEFALRAPVILDSNPKGDLLPFAQRATRGDLSLRDWWTHLTTLFPEVRPKGHIEVRSMDAVAPEWYAAPVALLAGLVYHRPSLCAAGDLLGAPDPGLLVRAGHVGLADARIAGAARDLFEIALAGCAALGDAFLDAADREMAHEFFERYTRVSRSPADDIPIPNFS